VFTVVSRYKDDPFFDPLENILIGTASVFLQSLAYGLDLEDNNLVRRFYDLHIVLKHADDYRLQG
jgi:hypothetical protein